MRFPFSAVAVLWLAIIAAPSAGAVAHVAAARTEYTVMTKGVVAGRQYVDAVGPGRVKVDFSYRDNGRGPDLFEEIRVGVNGQIESFAATGRSTFLAPIDEMFSRSGGSASWRSKADRETRAQAAGIYVPVESSPEYLAAMARALLQSPDRKLPALPNGQLAIEKLAETQVRAGKGTAAVALYAVSGIGFEPNYVWLWRNDRRLFGVVSPFFAVLQKGWEESWQPLLKLQTAADDRKLQSIAEQHAHRPNGLVVFRNVKWFDAEAAQVRGPADVFVHHGRIASILPPHSPVTTKVTIIDGTGKTLLPGLFDMHGHTGAWDAVMQIAGGVTTLRDLGNDNAFLNQLKAKVDRGLTVGPHIVATGYIEGKSPFSSTGGIVVGDLAEAKQAIDWYAQHGYRQVKLYNSIRPEWVEGMAAHAHARGLRVSGHIPAFMRAEEAVRAGFDEIQHINQVMLNFLVKKDDDTRTLLRFYLVGDNAQDIDLESDRVRDFIRLLVERKTAVDPTLTAFEAMFNQRQGAPNPSYRMVAANVPPAVSRAWLTNSMNVTDENAARFQKSYAKLLGLVKKMYDAGIPILAGTDDVAGFTLHRELELYVAAGITPAQALQIATRNGARYSLVEARTGTIAVGKDADLVLVEGDPTADLGALRRIALTMKAGSWYFPADLYAAMGVKAFAAKATITQEGKDAK